MQDGVVSLVLIGFLFVAGMALIVKPFEIPKIGDGILRTGIAIAIMVISFLVGILLLVNIFTTFTFQEHPDVTLNDTAAVIIALVALATLGLAIWLAASQDIGRKEHKWLYATSVLQVATIFGIIAATLWLFANAEDILSVNVFLARFAVGLCSLLGFLVPIAIIGVALYLTNRARAPGSSV